MTNKPISEVIKKIEQRIVASSTQRGTKMVSHEEISAIRNHIATLEQQLAAERADAERWRFMRQFLTVEQIDGNEYDEPMMTVALKECAFESSMVGVECHLTVEQAFDASRVVAAEVKAEGAE